MLTWDFPPCSITAHQTLLHAEMHVRRNSTGSQLAAQQSLLCPTPRLYCAKVINTTKETQHRWSNPYLHLIFRVSPGKMTMWSFAMLSVGFSKNSSSARPDPNKEEEIIIRQAIQYGQNRHNAVEASFLFCKQFLIWGPTQCSHLRWCNSVERGFSHEIPLVCF